MFFGVRPTSPLRRGSREPALHSWETSPSHHLIMGAEGHRVNMGLRHQFAGVSLLREKKPLRSVYLEMTLTYICKILIDFSLKWCLSFLCYHPRFTRVHLSSAIGLQWCQSLRILVCISDRCMRKDPHIWSLKCFLDYLCLWFFPPWKPLIYGKSPGTQSQKTEFKYLIAFLFFLKMLSVHFFSHEVRITTSCRVVVAFNQMTNMNSL